MKRLRTSLVVWIIVFSTAIQQFHSKPEPNGYVGSERCASCHAAIAEIQLKSEHALTMRRVEKIPQLKNLLPIRFSDQENHIEYVLETSKNKSSGYDLVATKD